LETQQTSPQALVLECDLQHYLTFPQFARETIAFLAAALIIFLPCLPARFP
jgi:hypothetical protein